MKFWNVGLVMVVTAMLVGCGGGGQDAPSAPADADGGGAAYVSETLDTSYEGALDAGSQLGLGTLKLEETDDAVTPEQAKTLLPLWQALQGGVTADAEVEAVMKQIEGTMTTGQLDAIAAMQLTQEDLREWMQDRGPGMGGPGFPGGGEGEIPPAMATRQAEFENMSEEDMATRRAEFGGGGREVSPEMATRRAEFENMSEEDRAALRATMEAGGGMPGGMPGGFGGRGSGGMRSFFVVLNPLIELLTERAAE
jgi:hypothetical protein